MSLGHTGILLRFEGPHSRRDSSDVFFDYFAFLDFILMIYSYLMMMAREPVGDMGQQMSGRRRNLGGYGLW